MEKPKFVYVTHIATTPEKLWIAITSNEFIRQYWAGSTFESDWKVGSSLRHFTPDGRHVLNGKILVSDPPKLLSYTWQVVNMPDHPTKGMPTKVTFELKPQGPLVRLTLIHEELERGTEAYRNAAQAWSAILSGLKTLLEMGKPLGVDWDKVHGAEGAKL